MERGQFADEFKCEAVRFACQPDVSKAGVSKDFGINANMLYRWVRQQEGSLSNVAGSTNDVVSSGEFEQMRRESAKVRTKRGVS